MENQASHRWGKLIASVAILLFAGIIYAWSNIKAPLAEIWAGEDNKASLTFAYTLAVWFFCLGGLLSGFISKKISPKIRMIASAILIFLGFLLTSFLKNGNSIVLLYLFFSIFAGTGIGIVYNTVIATISGWFPDKKGICSGALMMGFGIGAFLLGLVAGNIIKNTPDNWRIVYRILGGASGLAVLAGAWIVKAPPKPADTGTVPAQEGMSAKEVLKRPSFWKLFVFFVFFSAVGASALGLAKDVSVSLNIPEGTAILIAAFASVSNSLGRLASGALVDGLGLKKTKLITSAVAIFAPLLTMGGILLSSAVLAVIGLLLCTFSYGFSPTVSAAFTLDFYGKRDYALNLSLINLVLIPGVFFTTLASMVEKAAGSYTPVFGILAGLSVIGLVINLSIRKP